MSSEIEPGFNADAQQEQRARAARARPGGDMEPIGGMVADALNAHRGAHEAYLRKRAAVIPSVCVGCSLDSPTMRGCLFSSDDGCKHRGALDLRGKAKDRLLRMKAGGVPQKFWTEVDRVESCEALNAVRRVLSGQAGIAVLLGTTGAGKSLCAGVAVAERGGIFASASGLSGSGDRVDDLQDALQDAPLVVLDDVGRGRSATPAALERTEDVICNRYDRSLATIVTANLLPWKAEEGASPGFWDLFGGEHGRIADRLGGTDRVTICTERSRRRDVTHWQERTEK